MLHQNAATIDLKAQLESCRLFSGYWYMPVQCLLLIFLLSVCLCLISHIVLPDVPGRFDYIAMELCAQNRAVPASSWLWYAKVLVSFVTTSHPDVLPHGDVVLRLITMLGAICRSGYVARKRADLKITGSRSQQIAIWFPSRYVVLKSPHGIRFKWNLFRTEHLNFVQSVCNPYGLKQQ